MVEKNTVEKKMMLTVRVFHGNLERAIKGLKRKIVMDGIFCEIRKQGLPKRSERKRKKQWIAAKRKQRAKSRLEKRRDR